MKHLLTVLLLSFCFAFVAQAQQVHNHCNHSFDELPAAITLPPMKLQKPTYKSGPQAWTVETVHAAHSAVTNPYTVLIVLDGAALTDLVNLQNAVYSSVNYTLQSEEYANYHGVIEYKLFYSVTNGSRYLSSLPRFNDLWNDIATIDYDAVIIVKNDSVYSGFMNQAGNGRTYAVTGLVAIEPTFRHEQGHLLATVTGGVIPFAVDEYNLPGAGITAIGYNLDTVQSSTILAPFIGAGYSLQGGYGVDGRGYIVESTYMGANIHSDPGVPMCNYVTNVIHHMVDDVIGNTLPVSGTTVQVQGISQSFTVDAFLCGTCAVRWSVNDSVVQSGKSKDFQHIFADYASEAQVLVEVEVVDTNILLVDQRNVKIWSRSWTVTPDTTVLPVTIIDTFTVSVGDNLDAILSWTTSLEYENNYFAVEISYDGGLTFTELAQLPSQGNTLTGHHYQYLHELPCDTIAEFRVTQICTMGSSESTAAKTAQTQECIGTGLVEVESSFIVYPNPVNDRLFISTPFTGSVAIINLTGKLVMQDDLNNLTMLDVHSLAPGVYLAQFTTGTHTFARKVVKQ